MSPIRNKIGPCVIVAASVGCAACEGVAESGADGEPFLWPFWTATACNLALLALLAMAAMRLQKLRRRHRDDLTDLRREIESAERDRFARDLHDSAGANLAALGYEVGRLKQAHPQMDALDRIIRYLEFTHREIRSISHRMHAADLANATFPEAVREYVERTRHTFGKERLHAEIHPRDGWEELGLDTLHNLYRMMQEALSNSIKHAEASYIFVQVIRHEDAAELSVEDDGKGIDPEIVRRGMGMQNLQARAEQIGGHVEVESSEQTGTYVRVVVPLGTAETAWPARLLPFLRQLRR